MSSSARLLEHIVARLEAELGLQVGAASALIGETSGRVRTAVRTDYAFHWHTGDEDQPCFSPIVAGAPTLADALIAGIEDLLDRYDALIDGLADAGIDLFDVVEDPAWWRTDALRAEMVEQAVQMQRVGAHTRETFVQILVSDPLWADLLTAVTSRPVEMQAQARKGLLRILSDSAVGLAVRALTNHIAEYGDVFDGEKLLLAVVPYADMDEESADALCLGGQDAERLRSELADAVLHHDEVADEDREQPGVFDPDSDVLLSVVDGELRIGVSADLVDAARATPAAFALVTLRVRIHEGADGDEWVDDEDADETLAGDFPIDLSDLDFTEMTLGEIGDAIGQRLEAAYDAAIAQGREEELQRQLAEAGDDVRARMMIFSRFQQTDAALAEVARAFPGADALSRLNIAQARALIYRDAERWDEALAELTHAIGILNELPDEASGMLQRTRLMHMIGQIYLVQHNLDQAEEYIDRANALLVSLSAQAPRERQVAGQQAFGMDLLGDLEIARYEEQGNRQALDRAEAAYREALARCKQARLMRDHPVRHYCASGLERIAELRKQVDQGSGAE